MWNKLNVIIRYILDLHRIPAKSSSGPKQVVFLQHGVAESSATWLVNPASRSLRIMANHNLIITHSD